MSEYFEAPEVKAIADDLISTVHRHLRAVRMEYVFVEPTPKQRGKEIWGRVRKMTGLPAWLAADDNFRGSEVEPFFVVEISREIWSVITNDQRKALVDHELMHCGWDREKEQIVTVPHDVEEFIGVIDRHGLWRHDVERLVEVAKEKEAVPLFSEQVDSASAN